MVNKVRLFSPISKLSIFVTGISQNRVKRQHFICLLFLMTFGVSWIYIIQEEPKIYSIYDYNRTNNILLEKLHETVLEDKGMGCDYPKVDPFAPELAMFDIDMPKLVCEGLDWVNCEKSQCYVVKEILNQMKTVSCTYKDILYISDVESKVGAGTRVVGNKNYTLTASDYVKVSCSGKGKESIGLISSKWYGYKAGLREVSPQPAPKGREDSLNVLILGFDSTSRNIFIRRMPKSYKYLTEDLGSIVLKGYNIVGDATPAALFPILSGKSELEHPDTRVDYTKSFLDEESFIFHLLKNDGYRTAYYEDMPWIGTFQYRFNGFRHQPADHYLRAFLMEETKAGRKWWSGVKGRHCIGTMPQYLLFLNLTTQFHQLKGKKFSFTFIADITHDEFNLISTSDDDVVAFLKDFYESGRGEDTLLIVMGDHGPRWAKVRNSFYGKIEERQPLMSVRLPGRLVRARPAAQAHLRANADLLTTPFDIHSTLLDAMDLRQHANEFVVKGADYPRALSLLRPIPKSRSCGEAGVLPHWCLCIKWHNVTQSSPKYKQVVGIVVDFINNMVLEHRMVCAQRQLTSVEWVARGVTSNVTYSTPGHDVNIPFLKHYMGARGAHSNVEHYQAKIVLSPGKAIYEASVRYFVKEDSYAVSDSDVSRINAYGDEPHCVSKTHPQLNKYCYCVKQLRRDGSDGAEQADDVDL